jgi:uncharacterized membrane protein YkvA (DUF1232 family)
MTGTWIGIALGVLVVPWLVLVAGLALAGRRRAATDVARFLPDCIVLLKRLLGDRRVPRSAKIAIAVLLPYLALPLDLIPDFIPVVGLLDDAVLVAVVIGYVVRRAGRALVEEHWPGSPEAVRPLLVVA